MEQTHTASRMPVVQADAAATRDDAAAQRLWSWLQEKGATAKGTKVTANTEQGLAILADRRATSSLTRSLCDEDQTAQKQGAAVARRETNQLKLHHPISTHTSIASPPPPTPDPASRAADTPLWPRHTHTHAHAQLPGR